MSVLITGASGFVGAWLTRRLADEGQSVIAQMRRAPSKLFCGLGMDAHSNVTVITDPAMHDVLIQTAPQELYHLGGMSQIGEALASPVVALEANARASWLLFEAMRELEAPPRTIVASTDSIYGETGGRAATEDDLPRATGPYEVSKLAADYAARCYAGLFTLPIVVARLGNVYGPGDSNGARIIPSLVSAVEKNEPPTLRGGGRAVRSLLHVDDCISGLRTMIAKADAQDVQGQAFNLSGATPMTILDIARTGLAAMGRADLEPIVIEGAPGETSVKFSSTEKAQRVFGWAPQLSLAEGMATVRSFTKGNT